MHYNKKYRGDSSGKKISRLAFWLHVRKLLGMKSFLAGPHLVLPSREAGDTSVLLGLGVPLSNIIGVDWNPNEAAQARAKFPGFQVHAMDVAAYARKTKQRFASAFLDFCSTSNPEGFDCVQSVAEHCMLAGSLLGCAFMVGREHSYAKMALQQRRSVEAQVAEMSPARKVDAEQLVAYFSRAFLIHHELEQRVKVPLDLAARFFYSSKDDAWHGHPWCGQLFWVDAQKKSKEVECFYFDSTREDLRKQALVLDKKGEAALLLNVPQTSLSAWKAHASRGTYAKQA